MQNAHLRLAQLEFHKPATSRKSSTTHVTVSMDRVIVEPALDVSQLPRCHLLSVFGGEQEIAAIHAAVVDRAHFRVAGPGLPDCLVHLGENAHTFRGLFQAPGRKQPVRHVVALSEELFETQPGRQVKADRTVLYSAEPEFLAYRLSVRFGIPVLPCWSQWLSATLTAQNRIQTLSGLGCHPVLVRATKQELLTLLADALRRGVLSIPATTPSNWNVSQAFSVNVL